MLPLRLVNIISDYINDGECVITCFLKRLQELKNTKSEIDWYSLSKNPAIFYFKRLNRYDPLLKEI